MFIVIEAWDILNPTICTDVDGNTLLFYSEEPAQTEASLCQRGIVVDINPQKAQSDGLTMVHPPHKIPNEVLLGLVEELFELDGFLKFNWLGMSDSSKTIVAVKMSKETRAIVDRLESINHVLSLYGVTDEEGEFLLMPDNQELEDKIRSISDVYCLVMKELSKK